MLKYVVGGALAVCLASQASSADLPAGVAPAMIVQNAGAPLFTWGGFYVGAQLGHGWTRDRLVETPICAPCQKIGATGAADGFVGGLHAGINWQLGKFVYGLEADVENGQQSHRTVFPLSEPDTFMTNIGLQASLRARFGFVLDRLLVYGTGGFVAADVHHAYDFYENIGGVFVRTASQSFSDLRTGWTIGAGVEFAIAPNWSARMEYRYVDLGSVVNRVTIFVTPFEERHRETQHAVRLGVSYRY
jgi:outer membrane immunogenic protein